MVEDWLVMFLDHFGEEFDVLEEGQPELGDALNIGTRLVTAGEKLGVVLIGETVY